MIRNLIGAEWRSPADGVSSLPIFNPATGQEIEQVPLSRQPDVDAAVNAAVRAFPGWSRTALMERVRLMFRFKALLEEHFEELASIITRHHGKTLEESRGEVRRGIEVVDFACGAPTLLQGRTLRDVSGGVDQDLYRYPVGVCAAIPPFNFGCSRSPSSRGTRSSSSLPSGRHSGLSGWPRYFSRRDSPMAC